MYSCPEAVLGDGPPVVEKFIKIFSLPFRLGGGQKSEKSEKFQFVLKIFDLDQSGQNWSELDGCGKKNEF